jgi:hypothetical protein
MKTIISVIITLFITCAVLLMIGNVGLLYIEYISDTPIKGLTSLILVLAVTYYIHSPSN